ADLHGLLVLMPGADLPDLIVCREPAVNKRRIGRVVGITVLTDKHHPQPAIGGRIHLVVKTVVVQLNAESGQPLGKEIGIAPVLMPAIRVPQIGIVVANDAEHGEVRAENLVCHLEKAVGVVVIVEVAEVNDEVRLLRPYQLQHIEVVLVKAGVANKRDFKLRVGRRHDRPRPVGQEPHAVDDSRHQQNADCHVLQERQRLGEGCSVRIRPDRLLLSIHLSPSPHVQKPAARRTLAIPDAAGSGCRGRYPTSARSLPVPQYLPLPLSVTSHALSPTGAVPLAAGQSPRRERSRASVCRSRYPEHTRYPSPSPGTRTRSPAGYGTGSNTGRPLQARRRAAIPSANPR